MITATACLLVLFCKVYLGKEYTQKTKSETLLIYIFSKYVLETKFHIRLTGDGKKEMLNELLLLFFTEMYVKTRHLFHTNQIT